MQEAETSIAGFVFKEMKPWTPKKRTFRKIMNDLLYAANCLVAIGEQGLGDELGKVVEKMNDHAEFGENAKATASEGAV